MHKVAITDYTFGNLDVEEAILGPAGCQVSAGQCRTPEALIELTSDADAVITQFAPVTAEVVGRMEKAKVIVRYGIGYDNVALEAARPAASRCATSPTTASTRWPTTPWP